MSKRFICLLLILIISIMFSLCSSNITNETIENNQSESENEINEKYNKLVNSTFINILNEENFEETVSKQKCGLIAFTVPWCEHSNQLHPVYLEAAEILKDEEFKLYHINPEENLKTSEKYEINSYPTLKYIKNNQLIEYEFSKNSGREIATIMKKVCGDLIIKYDSLETVYNDINKYNRTLVVFANQYDDNYKGEELINALEKISEKHNDILIATCFTTEMLCNSIAYENDFSKSTNNFTHSFQNFILSINNDLLKYHEENEFRRPKNFTYSSIFFFSKQENQNEVDVDSIENLKLPDETKIEEKLKSFVYKNGYSLVNKLEDRTAEIAFNKGEASLFFFRNSSSEFAEYDEVFKKAAKLLEGKTLFYTFSLENEIEAKLGDLLFVDNDDFPQIRIIYTLNDDEIRTYLLPFNFTNPEKGQLNENFIVDFYQNFTENKLEPYYKSEPIPENNTNSTIKKVVGSTFNDLVYDTNKFRIIKIYLPWDILCKQVKPIYEKIADKFFNHTDLVFTELDFSKNEVPNNFVRAYPMIFFWKKGELKPTTYMGDRTFESLEDFILINMGLPPINNYNDNQDEEEAPTVPVDDFFRVNKEDLPELHDIPDAEEPKQDL